MTNPSATEHPVVGARRELVLVEELTRTQIVQYAGASGDYNPVHSDEPFAINVAGYGSVFAHGMLTMAMTARVVTDWFGVDQLSSYGARFVAQVWPGDTLTATATVERIEPTGDALTVDVSISTVNQRGDEVLTGTATVTLGVS